MRRIGRRELLRRVGGAAPGLPLLAASGAGSQAAVPLPILDIHQHPDFDQRPAETLMRHQRFHRVKTTVLLPADGWMTGRISGNAAAWSHVRRYPEEVVTFCNVDPVREDAVQVLREQLERGALGIGEQKFEAVAGPPEGISSGPPDVEANHLRQRGPDAAAADLTARDDFCHGLLTPKMLVGTGRFELPTP